MLALCLGVYISNPKKQVNKTLTAFLLSGFLWLIANLFTNLSTHEGTALFFARSTLVGAALIPLSFLCFVVSYTQYRKLDKKFLARISALPILIILFTPTSLNILSIEANGSNAVAGPVYVPLIVVLISYFSFGIYKLYKYYQKSPPLQRSQIQYIFTGLILTIIPGLITNGILPLFGSGNSSTYGSSTVVIISVFMTIAIVRHRLLDIRLVVARSLAYVLVLATLSIIFIVLLLGLTNFLFHQERITIQLEVSYIIIALLLAVSFQPLKRFFDRITNKIFFRDYYEPQTIIDQMTNLLVGSVNVKEIENGSSRILRQALKPDFIEYVLNVKNNHDSVIYSLLTTLSQFPHDIVTLDEVDQKKHPELHKLLTTKSIAVAVRLSANNQTLGYILLGYKQSGTIYTDIDRRLLSTVSDEVAISLQNALRFEEIQQFNVTLQEKVDEATNKLRHANARLKELDATKDEFISMASHQLRTPLTTIKGYLSMILDGDVGKVKAEEKEMVQHAFDSAQRMVYLIADLLNVSRLQSGKFVIDNKPTDLVSVVKGEVEQLKEQTANHKIKMSYSPPKEFPILSLDETKIRQVIMNFLDNALYYTPAGGEVRVALAATASSASFTVTDTGVGVPKDIQHHLFTKFYRADNARKMRPDGTGLGLYMAKKVIVAQSGAIIFHSQEGKGSTFGFSFPRATTEVNNN